MAALQLQGTQNICNSIIGELQQLLQKLAG